MWLSILAGFLAIHGLIHVAYISPPAVDPRYPFDLDKSWLIAYLDFERPFVRTIGHILTIATVLAFMLSAIISLGLIVPQVWFRPVTLIAACFSTLLLVLFWNRSLVVGVAIDLALIASLIWFNWPIPALTAG